MDYQAQLRLQAFLDGELSEAEAREVANWLARDRDAVALHAELRNTRQAMVGHEIGVELPESREFFWSKIEREIQRLEPPAVEPARRPFWSGWRRFLVPASAVAALGVALFIVLKPSPGTFVESAFADPGAFTYRDFSAGATLVWLSYPAEEEVAQDDEMGSE
jgi:anti-sigma factor RsiW